MLSLRGEEKEESPFEKRGQEQQEGGRKRAVLPRKKV